MRQVKRLEDEAPQALKGSQTEDARNAIMKLFHMYHSGGHEAQYLSQDRVNIDQHFYKGSDLDDALRSVFKNKCAFCEQQVETHIYRFRPPTNAAPINAAHTAEVNFGQLYYTWLINDWNNLFPICGSCYPETPHYFPVEGSRCKFPSLEELSDILLQNPAHSHVTQFERPTLISPGGSETLGDYLIPSWNGRISWDLEGSHRFQERSLETLRHFKLNRPQLVALRKTAYRNYFQHLIGGNGESETTASNPLEFETLEFGGSWAHLLWNLYCRLSPSDETRPPDDLNEIRNQVADSLGKPGTVEGLKSLQSEAEQSTFPPPLDEAAQPQNPSPRIPTSVEIQNFKSLERFDLNIPYDDTESVRNKGGGLIILGENATGKSAVLEALAIALHGDQIDPDSPPPHLKLERLPLKPNQLGASPGAVPRCATIKLNFDEDDADETEAEGHKVFNISPDGALTVEGELEGTIVPVFAYGAVRMFEQDDTPEIDQIQPLFYWKTGLPDPQAWIIGLHRDTEDVKKAQFKDLLRLLRTVILYDNSQATILEVEDDQCILLRHVIGEDGTISETRTPLQDTSSGYRAVLGLVCDIARRAMVLEQNSRQYGSLQNTRAIVLIDEIESHLHPSWKLRILPALRKAFENIIFIVTTHDPLCLRALENEEIMVLQRRLKTQDEIDEMGEEIPQIVEPITDFNALTGFTVDQLLTSDLFGIYDVSDSSSAATMAEISDLLALNSENRTTEQNERLAKLRENLASKVSINIPLGNTQVEALIVAALEEFLTKRRNLQHDEVNELKGETKAKIAAKLKDIFDETS